MKSLFVGIALLVAVVVAQREEATEEEEGTAAECTTPECQQQAAIQQQRALLRQMQYDLMNMLNRLHSSLYTQQVLLNQDDQPSSTRPR
ncbi:unnamed protein product [Mesocestoides corti]|uniref:Metalloproteinase inhibitor 1 n=1 Tax=Mesocestoides corti TaxID=53468 RepID=A0A0R3U4H4_MESCO|nr:unnamed protein product [Mesocestoides corti]